MATSINDLGGDTATFTEGGAPVLLDDSSAPEAAATVTSDQTELNGGNLIVSITANEDAGEDVLGISTGGTITLSDGTNVGSVVSVGGLAIGTITANGTGGNDLVVSFNTNDATPATVSLLVQALTYSNADTVNPSTLARTISVTVNDGEGGSDSESVSVNVTAVNDPPIAVDDSLAATEDTPVTYAAADLTGNDSDGGDGGPLVISNVTNATNGTAQLNGNGTVTFTPASNFNGTAGFDYLVSDGIASDTGHATITVAAVNDDPDAVDDSVSVAEDSGANDLTTQLLSNDTDAENDTRTITSATQGTNGTTSVVAGALTYTPNANFNGTDTFTYTISDGNGGTDTATVNVTVTAANDPPIAVDDSLGATEDTPVTYAAADLTGNDSDGGDGGPLVISNVTNSTNGTAILNGNGTVTFTPAPGFSGTAGFDYLVSDGTDSDTGHATITVTAVNDPPVAVDDSLAATEDTAVTYAATDLIGNDSDGGDGGPLVISSVSNSTGGLAVLNGDGTVTFTPTPHFNGTAGFDYVVSDGTDSDTGHATVNVAAVNDPVTTSAPATVSNVPEDAAAFAITGMSISDVDATLAPNGVYSVTLSATEGTLTLTTSTGLTFDTGDGSGDTTMTFHGTLSNINNALASAKYAPNLNYNGPAQIDLQATDVFNAIVATGTGSSTSDSDTIAVTVLAVNDQPAVDLNGVGGGTTTSINYTEGEVSKKIAPAATVTDIDSTGFDGGTLTVALTANGIETDRLSIIDQGSGADKITVDENSIYYNFGDVDAGGNFTRVELIGTFSGGNDGSTPLVINLTASADAEAVQALVRTIGYFNQGDAPGTSARTATFTLTDGDGGTGTPVNATINVTDTPDAAVAENDSVATPENEVLSGNVFNPNGSGNDFDPDGTSFEVIAVNGSAVAVGIELTLSSGAKLRVKSDGTFTYNPNGKFNTLVDPGSGAVNIAAVETFQYTITGGDTATVTVVIGGVESPDDIYLGDGTDNTITGTGGGNQIRVHQGGNDSVFGLGGADSIYFGAAYTLADSVDGGGGQDFLFLQGNYNLMSGTGTLTGIERLSLLSGSVTDFGDTAGNTYTYTIVMQDSNLAAGQRLIVGGLTLGANEVLDFNGLAESNGTFQVFGGAASDRIYGGQGNDHLLGGGGDDYLRGGPGNDRLWGGPGSDILLGGFGFDIYVFSSAAESTGLGFDRIFTFHPKSDDIILPNLVTGWSGSVSTGQLDVATFNADLAAAVNGLLNPNMAVLFTPDSGSFAGRTFGIFDLDGDGSYQAGQDIVLEFDDLAGPIDPLAPTNEYLF